MRVAHRQIDASLAQDLLDRIRTAPPEFFERLIVNLLLNMGFGGSAAEAGRAIWDQVRSVQGVGQVIERRSDRPRVAAEFVAPAARNRM